MGATAGETTVACDGVAVSFKCQPSTPLHVYTSSCFPPPHRPSLPPCTTHLTPFTQRRRLISRSSSFIVSCSHDSDNGQLYPTVACHHCPIPHRTVLLGRPRQRCRAVELSAVGDVEPFHLAFAALPPTTSCVPPPPHFLKCLPIGRGMRGRTTTLLPPTRPRQPQPPLPTSPRPPAVRWPRMATPALPPLLPHKPPTLPTPLWRHPPVDGQTSPPTATPPAATDPTTRTVKRRQRMKGTTPSLVEVSSSTTRQHLLPFPSATPPTLTALR
jgi:hypothetical protein